VGAAILGNGSPSTRTASFLMVTRTWKPSQRHEANSPVAEAVPAICAAIRTAQFALPTPAIAVRGLDISRRDCPNGVGQARPIHWPCLSKAVLIACEPQKWGHHRQNGGPRDFCRRLTVERGMGTNRASGKSANSRLRDSFRCRSADQILFEIALPSYARTSGRSVQLRQRPAATRQQWFQVWPSAGRWDGFRAV
jgi:hypothetical protein